MEEYWEGGGEERVRVTMGARDERFAMENLREVWAEAAEMWRDVMRWVWVERSKWEEREEGKDIWEYP